MYMGALITSMVLSECHKNVTADQADPAQNMLQNTLQNRTRYRLNNIPIVLIICLHFIRVRSTLVWCRMAVRSLYTKLCMWQEVLMEITMNFIYAGRPHYWFKLWQWTWGGVWKGWAQLSTRVWILGNSAGMIPQLWNMYYYTLGRQGKVPTQ